MLLILRQRRYGKPLRNDSGIPTSQSSARVSYIIILVASMQYSYIPRCGLARPSLINMAEHATLVFVIDQIR